ncbi:hypothetical protein EV193_107133 [Herbihabitans rhizosphaerae]|uniref:Uncharacterized protein n=1 Tax=Herbihabitans rhizosphaerae TaxID=1872711 RepID=A0A4Q7KMM4_9PSEU|nr:hypothetical protein EV193_107133 [Herbihabitans rhizosphaerae]
MITGVLLAVLVGYAGVAWVIDRRRAQARPVRCPRQSSQTR